MNEDESADFSLCACADLLRTDWNISQWHKLPQTLVPVCVYPDCILGGGSDRGCMFGGIDGWTASLEEVMAFPLTFHHYFPTFLTQRKCCRRAIH